MARLTLATAEPPKPEGFTVLADLDTLYLHPLNARREPPAADIAALADSIRQAGLLQNLSGFADHQIRFRDGHHTADPEHIGIVAGGRRLRALQLLRAQGEWPGFVPVSITHDLDTAKLWAGAENEAREPLSVADEITAYAQMRQTGASVAEVAAAFAKPQRHVAQRLMLATLPDAAIEALRAQKINLDVARLLTRVTNPAEAESLLDVCIKNRLSSWELKARLDSDAVSLNTREAIYVGIDAIHAAGLRVTYDLFEDRTMIHGRDRLVELARSKALEELEAVRAAEGWSWAALQGDLDWSGSTQIHGEAPDLPEGDSERMDELVELAEGGVLDEAGTAELQALEARLEPVFTDEQRATCGIVGALSHNGTLTIRRAFRRLADAPPADEDDTTETRTIAPEPAFPQNLRDDLRAIRLICIQDALRRDPDLCQRLLALQLTGQHPRYEPPFDFTPHHSLPYPVAPQPSKTEGLATPKALAAPTGPIAADLTLVTGGGAVVDQMVTDGLARAFCRTTGPLVDLIHRRSPVNVRALWHPTVAGFLGRCSGGYLDALWRELVPDDGKRHAGFALSPKKEKVRELDQLFNGHELREALGLTRTENDRIDAWTPEDLRFAAAEVPE